MVKEVKEPRIPPALMWCRIFAVPYKVLATQVPTENKYEKNCVPCVDHAACTRRLEWELHMHGICQIAWCNICRKQNGLEPYVRGELQNIGERQRKIII